MARVAVLSFLFAALMFALIPSSHAGPACARRNSGTGICTSRCKGKWGYPGRVMGTDPWGKVMTRTFTDMNGVVTSACRVKQTPSASSSSVAANATPSSQAPNAVGALPVFSPSPSTLSATSVLPSFSSVSSSFVSSSTSRLPTLVSEKSKSSPSSSYEPPAPAPAPTTEESKPAPTPSPTPEQPETSTSKQSEPTPEPQPASALAPSPEPKPSPSPSPAPSTPASASSSSDQTSSSDIEQYLSAHNTIRAQHGASALTWSDELASKAQQWANGCIFQHSGGSLGPFGENLAAGTGSSYGISAAVKSWTDEVSEYDPNNPQPSHFTQVVWKASTQVGCAVQSCSGIFAASFGPAQFFVCEYSPQGNIIGEFAQNVQV
ncbi:CAP domain-containing protein [Cytidiella melzeri]|nr:CAP domain-containing protein [Cytidiella melzeri]